ncbi:MAG: hydrolase [Burkholderiales bacterium]
MPKNSPMNGAYTCPPWLPGGQVQTLYAYFVAKRPKISYRRERWDTPDGDFIDIDWVDGNTDAPLVVLFHGLEGNSQSQYALQLMHAVQRKDWRGAVVHFRGCSGELNRLPRAYHSGDTVEIDWVLQRMKQLSPPAPLYAVGVSLGGNALLKWLGERQHEAKAVVQAAAAISAPLDLMAAGDALGVGLNKLYTRHFLSTLKHKAALKLRQHPRLFDSAAMLGTRNLREFDDIVTAPLHGFRDTDDYWTRASCKPLLKHISVPTLLINARNDPFLPSHALPRDGELSASITAEFPAHGGHVGFVSGRFPGNLQWMPQRLMHFFNDNKG